MKTKRIVIIGSTGSIGRQTLDVVQSLGARFRVTGLAAGRNETLLEEQARRFRPRHIWAEQDQARPALLAAAGPGARWTPMEEQVADPDVDLVVVGTVGRTGLEPTLAALRAGKAVVLANKEVLVMAGAVITKAASDGGGELLPVDSEHSAIWQCLWGEERDAIARVLLTASGGAFRDYSPQQLEAVTPEQALNHPTWQMGRKITVDSATLINKGFEVIETRWLFDVPLDKIEIVMHRESIIHSLVEFVDGSVKAQVGDPDMRVPIQYALTYPRRMPGIAARLDFGRRMQLDFEPPDAERFGALALGLEVAKSGGTAGAVLNAANEAAVARFRAGELHFTDIVPSCRAGLEQHHFDPSPSLDELEKLDVWARQEVLRWACL